MIIHLHPFDSLTVPLDDACICLQELGKAFLRLCSLSDHMQHAFPIRPQSFVQVGLLLVAEVIGLLKTHNT